MPVGGELVGESGTWREEGRDEKSAWERRGKMAKESTRAAKRYEFVCLGSCGVVVFSARATLLCLDVVRRTSNLCNEVDFSSMQGNVVSNRNGNGRCRVNEKEKIKEEPFVHIA